MMKHSKEVSGIILIAFLLPMLACNYPRSFLRSRFPAMTNQEYAEEEEKIKDEFGAILVPDNYDILPSEIDQAVDPTKYSCTINTKSFYDVYIEHRQSPLAKTNKSEVKLILVSFYPNLTFDFSFHAIGTLKNVHPDGTLLGNIEYEHLESGKGNAIWEDDYFYGTISYQKVEITTYNEETSEHKTSGELTGIGAWSPNRKEIHVCLEGLSIDQFDMIKVQPFDQLRAACISNHYFICTPE